MGKAYFNELLLLKAEVSLIFANTAVKKFRAEWKRARGVVGRPQQAILLSTLVNFLPSLLRPTSGRVCSKNFRFLSPREISSFYRFRSVETRGYDVYFDIREKFRESNNNKKFASFWKTNPRIEVFL